MFFYYKNIDIFTHMKETLINGTYSEVIGFILTNKEIMLSHGDRAIHWLGLRFDKNFDGTFDSLMENTEEYREFIDLLT